MDSRFTRCCQQGCIRMKFFVHRLWFAIVAVTASISAPSLGSHRETPLVLAIKQARPAVVNIRSEKLAPGQTDSAANKMSGMGTGVIVDERGYIVTNYHVIEDVSSIRVTLVDGSTYQAEIAARDPETDLALLRIRPLSERERDSLPHLSVMTLGRSDDLMHGETVIAIGNAYGYEHTITSGIISELHRNVQLSATQRYRDLIQTDASINPGNSGGPLINADGEMIGLNVAIRAGAQGIGFAIPVDQVKDVLAELLSVHRLKGTWHGIVAGIENNEVVVREIEPGSPADHAGLRPGDSIVRLADQDVRFAFDIERALLDKSPREEVSLEIARADGPHTLHLQLASVPDRSAVTTLVSDDPVWSQLGVRLAPYSAPQELRRYSSELRGGLVIEEVRPGSPAERAGLVPADILVGMHQLETRTESHVRYVLQLQEKDAIDPLTFHVVRNARMYRGYIHFVR